MAILVPECRCPSNEIVSRPKMPCGGAEGKACNRSVPGKSRVFEVFSHGLGISEVMSVRDKAVEKFFPGASSHLANRYGKKLPQSHPDEALVDVNPFRGVSVQERVFERDLLSGRQPDGALSLQVQQEPPADHVLWLAVWLGPVPCEAQPPREGTAPFLRMFGDRLPDKSHIRG